MALKLSSDIDHASGYIVLVYLVLFYENPWKPSNPKLMHFRPVDGEFTSFFSAGIVCTENAQSHLSHNQQR